MTTDLDVLDITRRLIAMNTINPPGSEQKCAEFVGDILSQHGFDVRFHQFGEGRTNLVATLGKASAGTPLCFTGHLDTVPLGQVPWKQDPFGGKIIGGRLYGRGSSDMKAGVAAFVTAVCGLAGQLGDTRGVALVITGGEETGCEGASALVRDGILGTAGAIVVGEPTANVPMAGHKGALWLEAVTMGVTAHGSMPHLGVNAIYKAARVVSKLEDYCFNLGGHEAMGGATLNVGTISGGRNVNSVPDRVEIGIDIRTVPNHDHVAIADNISSYLGNEVALTPMVDLPSVWTDPDDPWLTQVQEIVDGIRHIDKPLKGASYFTDASVLRQSFGNIPTVILGPGEPSLAHQTDEYCNVEKIQESVEIYRRLTMRWCGLEPVIQR